MVNAPERFAIVKWMPAMLVGGLVASLAAAVFVVIASRAESADRGYREHRSELTVLAGAMPSQAAAAARGDAEASEKLGASRETLERAEKLYRAQHATPDGRVKASFEIVYLAGWAPDPSQQQPLKPGSAAQRLADALGTTERSAGDKTPFPPARAGPSKTR